jgi:hypothetical protein
MGPPEEGGSLSHPKMPGAWSTFKASVAVLWRSRFFAQLAMITAVSGLAFTCLQDFLFNYLALTLGMGASSNAGIVALLGSGNLVVQVCALCSDP